MTIFQILILAFILFVIYKALRKLWAKDISLGLFILWLFIWLTVAVIDLFPTAINYAAIYLGIGRGVDLLIYVSILVLLYNQFKLSTRLNNTNRKFTELVRRLALLEKSNKQN